MTSVPESSKDTGPMLPGFETCETATEQRWPTPGAHDATGRAHRTFDKGNWKEASLEVAVLNLLTSSAAASPASPSATPASERENPIAAGFGLSSTESYARFNPDGSLLKTCQGYVQSTLDGSLEEYSETFPKQGSMRSGRLYPLPTSERPTSESESSLRPRPNARGDLQAAVWPTPTATERENDVSATPSQASLERYEKGEIARIRKTRAPTLTTAVRWPTPRTTDSHGAGEHGQGGPDLRTAAGGQLNADWVSLLMGFTADWTVVGGSAESRESSKDRRTE
ncbi:hypothetical protein LCGC14_1343800 [marine sediment metagenome]|uniref:Uncharacterized protein n=1 Tax=marine sediment metagenome TaxID=412755 RepID=A0A0F9MTT1_9ZZZZ